MAQENGQVAFFRTNGRKGGKTVLRKYGRDHFAALALKSHAAQRRAKRAAAGKKARSR